MKKRFGIEKEDDDISAILTLRHQGRLDLALAKANNILKLSFSINILSLIIDMLVEKQDGESALRLIKKYNIEITSDGESREFVMAKAKALLSTGQKPEALHLFHQLTQSFPTWADGWNSYGCCLKSMARYSEAIPLLKKALILDPGHTKATFALSSIYKIDEMFEIASDTISNCLKISEDPKLIEALINLLHRANKNKEALAWAKKLISSQQGQDTEQIMLLARAYFLCDDLTNYILTLRRFSEASLWKGVSTQSIAEGMIIECGLENNIESKLKDIIKISPADPNVNLNLAREKLRKFDFQNGWRHYSHRVNLPNTQLHLNQRPDWDGCRLIDKNILLIGEQGIGDVSYFSRFLQPLCESNQNIYMLCEQRMQSFLQSNYPKIYFFSDPSYINFLPKPLVKVAIGSLPLLYGNDKELIYELGKKNPLKPKQADQNIWFQRLRNDSGGLPIIGISLQGGRPGDEFQQKKRNLPMKKILKILEGKEICLVNLQHSRNQPSNNVSSIANQLGLKLLEYKGLTHDISQLIAVMACLDGLVTAQQTNAHLAGALGLRGLVALPVVAHFVFGNSDLTPWYPSLQLVRSEEFGKWDTCIDSLREKIDNWLLV